MTTRFEWVKLGLENWKTVLSIITLLLGLITSSGFNYVQSEETKSYKQGYTALAENVSKAQKQHVPRETPLNVDNLKARVSKLETRVNKLERHH